jgi:uncharacterized coiled-coil DUF342 family protein
VVIELLEEIKNLREDRDNLEKQINELLKKWKKL